MTKIDFYIAAESSSKVANDSAGDHHHIACRIIEKAYRRNLSVYVHTDDHTEAETLDHLLWTFRANSFIPHTLDVGEATAGSIEQADTPEVLISAKGEPRQHTDVLVNLSSESPDFFRRFLRLAEIVSADTQAKALSRERYKYYREQGYPLNVHQL